jgi:hypothetical protein
MDFAGLVQIFLGILALLIPVIIGLAFVVLMWGVLQAWILHGGNAENVKEGRAIAVWGIIGLVVMICIWGLAALIKSSLAL